MFDLNQHPYFQAWRDPQSGVVSHILTHRVADVQMCFYFATPSLQADGERLWMYCGFPPTQNKCLGVVSLDPAAPSARLLPRTFFQSESPMVETDGRSCFFTSGDSVWKIDDTGQVARVLKLPGELVSGRFVQRVATHLTRSADGRFLLLDSHIGGTWQVGVGDIETGEYRALTEFSHHMNHAQFSPTDPDTFSIAMDWFYHPVSGKQFYYTHRIWLMSTINGRMDAVDPRGVYDHNHKVSHEWWAPDGTLCWVHYDDGLFEHDTTTGQTTHVYKGPVCHGHTEATRQYWVWDESPYKWGEKPCEIMFFNRKTGKKAAIVAAMPLPPVPRSPLHIDPHPHFSADGQWIIYTTSVLGKIDIAMTRVSDLIEATA